MIEKRGLSEKLSRIRQTSDCYNDGGQTVCEMTDRAGLRLR